MRRRILLVDKLAVEDSYSTFMEEHLGVDFDISICSTIRQGTEKLLSFDPDIIYINMMTKDLDPLTLIHSISSTKGPTPIIIGTDPTDTYYVKQLNGLNITYVMVAPFSIEELGRQICELATYAIPVCGVYALTLLDFILLYLGFKCNVVKYNCIQYAVELKENDPKMGAVKELYPALAKRFDGTPGSVEKGLRDAIRCARDSGHPEIWNQYFPVLKSNETLSNDEFLNRMTLAVSRHERPHISMEEFLSKKKSTF